MSKSITAILEIVMLSACVLGRLAATAAIVWLLIRADLTNGWKVFLLALTIAFGLGFSVKYHNPYDKHETPAQIQKEDQ